MSGVWNFKQNGVVQLENPDPSPKVLFHIPTGEVITSYPVLESKLTALGWERYYDNPDLLQFHKRSTNHLISLPRDFRQLRPRDMFNIVVQNPNFFAVRDV